MPNCCVPGCGNKSSDPRCVDITFHRFPLNNKDILKVWIENLNLKEDQHIPDHRRVCSEHFDLQCFRQTSHNTTKRCLLTGSVPYKFNHLSVNLKRSNIENNNNNNNNNSEENMVHNCIVYGCKYRKKKNYTRGIIFHSFPIERERTQKWIEIINKNSLKPIHVTKHSKICQMHFLPDDYIYRNDVNSSSKFLKSNAIPSVFNLTDNINMGKIKSGKSKEDAIPLQQNTNVLNYTTQMLATSSSTSPSYNNDDDDDDDNDEEYIDDDVENNNNDNEIEIASDTETHSNKNNNNNNNSYNETTNDDIENRTVDIDINNQDDNDNDNDVDDNLMSHHNQLLLQNNQNDILNTSNRSNNSIKRRSLGLSDVINKLQSKQQQSNNASTSSLSSLLNNNENDEPTLGFNQQHKQESPESASISSVINAAAAASITPVKLSNIKQKAKNNTNQQQPLSTINNKIVINQSNKSEMDLYRLLERANLLQYFNSFTEKGGDDINQLCEADEDEFKEIIELVGMTSKPLHVKRLRKALDEYKHTKSECSNDSFEQITNNSAQSSQSNNNLTMPKCNLNSPIANTNSTYDSAISSSSSNINIPINYSLNQQRSQQQFQVPNLLQNYHQQQQQQQQHHHHQQQQQQNHQNDENYYQNDTTHDDSQYDSTNDLTTNNTSGYDYSNYNANKKKVRSRDSSESDCESEDGSGEYTNYNNDANAANSDSINNTSTLYVNNINNAADTSGNGDNSFIYKNGSNDQNEKNVKKSKVIELYTQGERCVRKLSQLTGVPLTTVYRVIGKLKGINYNIPRGNGAGRKTILDTQDREILVDILSAQPRISRKALGKELEKRTGKSIHNSTLNRELCRLRHQGANNSANDSSSSLNVTQQSNKLTSSPTSISTKQQQLQQSPTSTNNNINQSNTTNNNNNKRQALEIETNNNLTIPQQHQLSSSSSTISSISSSTSSYMAKDLIGPTSITKSTKNQDQQQQQQTKPLSLVNSNRLNNSSTPPPQQSSQQQQQQAASLIFAALGYPPAAAAAAAAASTRYPLLSQIQTPFNPFAATYSSYFSGSNDFPLNSFNSVAALTTPFYQTMDTETIKQINYEARKITDSIVKLEIKPLTNIQPEISTQVMEIINGNLNNDKLTRDDTIRKLINILIPQQQQQQQKTYYDLFFNEACTQLCILKPALLTRRDELNTYGKQIVATLGINENFNATKRTPINQNLTPTDLTTCNNNSNKRIKIENNYNAVDDMYQNYYNSFQQQQQQQQQQHLSSTPPPASSPSSSTTSTTTTTASKLWTAREERLENLKKEIQECLRKQEILRVQLITITQSTTDTENKSLIFYLQYQIAEELKKYNQLVDEQKRIEKQFKRKRSQKQQKLKIKVEDSNDNDEYENNEDDENNQYEENDAAVASLQNYTGDTTDNNQLGNDDENINVDEYDDDNQQQHMMNINNELTTTIKTDTNNNRSFV